MMYWVVNIISVCVLCIIFAGIIIPQILLIAFRKDLYDVPNERKIHKARVPRLGGIAFKPVIFFSIVFILGCNLALGYNDILVLFERDGLAVSFGFCAIMMLYLTGMADDLIGIRYRAKFVIQIICGIMLIIGGNWLNNLHGVFFIYHLSEWYGYPLALLVIVFIVNSMNLIDGIDGLASGLSSVAVILYGITFFLVGDYLYSLVSFATLGVLIPFFYYNVFGDPEKHKKIFMGDTGSLTVGLLVSILSLRMSMYPKDVTWGINPFVLAFIPLLIPCFDVVRVYIHRVRHRKNPFLPDKNHIHHKLLALGMNQRIAMILIISASVALCLLNIFLSRLININLLLLMDIIAWIFVNSWIFKKIQKKRIHDVTVY